MTSPIRIALLAALFLLLMPAQALGQPDAPAGCTAVIPPGADIAAAIIAARPNDIVCLAPGAHRPFVIDRRAPAGVTLRAAVPGASTIAAEGGDAIVILGAERLTIAGVTLYGGAPAGIYAAGTRELVLRNLRVQSAALGVHIDDGATAQLVDVTVTGAADVGLLVRRRASVAGERVSVLDSGGTGVAVVARADRLTLRDSEIAAAAGPGLFAGVPGCGELGAATLAVPACFYDDLRAYLSDGQVSLENVVVRDGPGTGLVFFPGVRAEIRNARVSRQRLTGLFAWGADVDVVQSEFDANWEHAIEYRAYPDPRGSVTRDAAGRIEQSVVRGTLPLGGPVLGGGILGQGARLTVVRNEVSGNAGIGIALVNGASGEVVENTVTDNGGSGLCLGPGVAVGVADNVMIGNLSDDIGVCREQF